MESLQPDLEHLWLEIPAGINIAKRLLESCTDLRAS